MYAVIASGGKQERVTEGELVNVELLGVDDGTVVDLVPVLFVDGDTVLATPAELAGVTITGKVVGEAKGPKINGFTYKKRTNQRRHYGHRQRYSVVEITSINKVAAKKSAAKKASAKPADEPTAMPADEPAGETADDKES